MKIENKILLITGGTGSFGHAVLSRFLHSEHFSEIRIFSRDEKKQDDMRNQLKNSKLKFFIGDVRDYDSVEPATRGVDYIFHAAALKQVETAEYNPFEFVKTNVFGSQNVIDAAIDAKNPRTSDRHLPQKTVSLLEAYGIVIVSYALYFFAAYNIIYTVLRCPCQQLFSTF